MRPLVSTVSLGLLPVAAVIVVAEVVAEAGELLVVVVAEAQRCPSLRRRRRRRLDLTSPSFRRKMAKSLMSRFEAERRENTSYMKLHSQVGHL